MLSVLSLRLRVLSSPDIVDSGTDGKGLKDIDLIAIEVAGRA